MISHFETIYVPGHNRSRFQELNGASTVAHYLSEGRAVDVVGTPEKSMNGSKDQSSVTELLEAARQARAMSDRLDSPDAKWGFQQLAAKWEAEAARLNKSLKH